MSTSADPAERPFLSARDLLMAAAVAALTLLLYLWTRGHSVAGLFPPDLAPPRSAGEEQTVEYVRRALAWPRVPGAGAICAAVAVGLAYLGSRLVASRGVAVAAALALGSGRIFWEQALLPGTPMMMAADTTDHVPLLMWGRWVFVEMNAAGMAFAIVGIASLLRTRAALGCLLLAAAATIALSTPLRGPSPHATLVLLFVIITPFVAAGAAAVLQWLRSRVMRAAILVLLPAVPLASNYRHATAEPDTISRWHLDALVHAARECGVLGLPDDAEIRPLPRDAAHGCQPLALPAARSAYEHLGYRFARVDQPGPALAAYEQMLPGGTVIATAIPSGFATSDSGLANLVRILGTDRAASTIARGSIGGTYPVMTVSAASENDGAVIRVDGTLLLRTRRAPAFAAFAPDGRPLLVAPLQGPPWRVPLDRERFGLSRVAGTAPCAQLAPGSWADVSGLAGEGRLGVHTGTGSDQVVLYAGRERPLDPWLVRSWGTAPTFSSAPVENAPATSAQDDLAPDRLQGLAALSRIELRANGARGLLASIDLSGIPTRLLAHANGADIRVCRAPRGEGFFVTDDVDVEHINGRRSFFGDGWGPAERRSGRDWRPVAQPEGELLVSLAQTHALRVIVTASTDPAGEIGLRINGRSLEPQPTKPGVADYTWRAPKDLWKTDVNQLFLSGTPGLKVADVQFIRSDQN